MWPQATGPRADGVITGTGKRVVSTHGAIQATDGGNPMSDKSPRQGMTKKTSKSIKEKRADKRAKGHEDTFLDKPVGKKR
jgi:hypothetical protein